MPKATLTLSFPEPDIAQLTFDTPDKGANILSQSVLKELQAHLDELEKRDDLAGLLFTSGKPEMFIAGADLREFAASLDISAEETVAMCRGGQQLFGRLSKTPFVTVAAISGICVGGGAELACWCDRRVMSRSPKAQIGFPEVKLGLFPGWGGTARATRILGLSNAVELVTGGESLDGRAAMEMNLADDVAPPDDLEAAAIRLIRADQASGQYLKDRQRWTEPVVISETELMFLGATANSYIQQQTKGQYPAPIAALEMMVGASMLDIDAACEAEAEGFAELWGTPINRALLNVFFLTDHNKKDTGLEGTPPAAKKITSVGVIGAGIMGQGIGSANVRRGMPITLSDTSTDALAAGVQNIIQECSYNRETKAPDVAKAVKCAPLVNGTTTDAELAACPLVIEAIVENAAIKKQVYANIEPQMADDALLATNTSTIPITQLAEGLKRPDQFLGLHFFNPVRKMPLVEVIRGEATSDETVATAVTYAKRIGKSPIVIKDGPGFLVNRLLFPYMGESVQLLLEGASIKAVEKAAKDFGMPMGPITLYDVVGLDTAMLAGGVMYEAYPDRTIPSPIVTALVKAGRLGQKTGSGFYIYDNPRNKTKGRPDEDFGKLIEPYLAEQREFTQEEITWRLFLPMLVEATRFLEEKLARDVRDVDLGLIYGIGFPPFKGGLLHWADSIGAAKLVELLEPLSELGPRYEVTPMLRDMAATGRKFYD